MGLIGPDLVPQNGQCVTPNGGGKGAADHSRRDGKTGASVNAPHVQAQQGHLWVSGLVQGLSGQADAAGTPAFISRLTHEYAAAGGVIFSGGQGREHLSGH